MNQPAMSHIGELPGSLATPMPVHATERTGHGGIKNHKPPHSASHYLNASKTFANTGVDRFRPVDGMLHDNTQRGAHILNASMDAIIAVDQDYRIMLFNRAAEELFRCTTERAMGQALDQFIPTRLRDVMRMHLQGVDIWHANIGCPRS